MPADRTSDHTRDHAGEQSGEQGDVLTVARLARYLERACTDLSLAQYRVLALVADGERHASRVAGALALTKPSVSATVESLAARGLVTRTVADHDRRATELAVTVAGHRVLEATEGAMRARLAELLAPDDAVVLADALTRVRTALDERRAQRRTTMSRGTRR